MYGYFASTSVVKLTINDVLRLMVKKTPSGLVDTGGIPFNETAKEKHHVESISVVSTETKALKYGYSNIGANIDMTGITGEKVKGESDGFDVTRD